MEPYGYAYEKLMLAVDGLATSPSRIQTRLENTYSACFMRLRDTDFPEGRNRDLFTSIYQRLTDAPDDPVRGKVSVATARMSDEEASKLASDILSLFHRIAALNFGYD